MHGLTLCANGGPCCHPFWILVSGQQNHLYVCGRDLSRPLALTDNLFLDLSAVHLCRGPGIDGDLSTVPDVKEYGGRLCVVYRNLVLGSDLAYGNSPGLDRGTVASSQKVRRILYERLYICHLHLDFLTMIASGSFCRHLDDSSHIGPHPSCLVETKSMSYLQVMVSECPRGEPFELAAGV